MLMLTLYPPDETTLVNKFEVWGASFKINGATGGRGMSLIIPELSALHPSKKNKGVNISSLYI